MATSSVSFGTKDHQDYQRKKKKIRRYKFVFWTIAQELYDVRERNLYRIEYPTFEAFCRDNLGVTTARVHQICQSFGNWEEEKATAKALGFPEPEKPKTEKEARKRYSKPGLLLLDTPNISKDSKPKTSEKRDYSGAYSSGHLDTPPKPDKETAKDDNGLPIPTEALACWNRRQEVQAMLSALSKLKSDLTRAQDCDDVLFREVSFNHAFSEIDTLYGTLKHGMPYAVCPECQGHAKKKCPLCLERGMISQFRWKTLLPEIKAAQQERARA